MIAYVRNTKHDRPRLSLSRVVRIIRIEKAMTYHSDRKHGVFISRSNAARHATRAGLRAFETMQVPLDPEAWTYEERQTGPGIDYALSWSEDKDWVHHVEITELAIPILIVTCFKHEITEDVPSLFELRPITPELWSKQRDDAAPMRNPHRMQRLDHTPSPRTIPHVYSAADLLSGIKINPETKAKN